ncbi:MAG: PHP domain-containing protein [Clostridia bacterium]|nr:PHP domain-containing protein [Clostridia bacterium]
MMKLYYDLHLHSCLSPCGDNEMTPYNLVNMAKIFGYDIIALTDHNTCKNCGSAMKVGEQAGITVVPGMELCTSEEIHCVCLFPSLEKAEAFSDYIRGTLPPVKNREKIFGEQLIMDTGDGILGKEEILLTTASSVSIDALPSLVEQYGGVCYPAHIDRSSYSIISSLGDFSPDLKVACFELTPQADEGHFLEKYPATKGKHIIRSSDAHYLENMREPEFYLELRENSPEALIEYLKLAEVEPARKESFK